MRYLYDDPTYQLTYCMDKNASMSVQNAIEIFTTIMRSLNTVDKQVFLSFIADNWKPQEIKIQSVSNDNCHKECSLQEKKLNEIKKIIIDIKNRIPFDGIFPSEHIVPPIIGENSDCDNKSTKHIDAFLYDDEEVDELIEKGELNNLYCSDCGSTNVKQYNIISHSMSVSDMLYIFHILPCLKEKIILDIGSRLGAVLYGAHIFTSAKKIIGVEMNKELCSLQCDIVNKYNMNDRIEIVNKRIEMCPDIIQKSDIIIMNNPFEFYVSELEHTKIWKFLKTNIQSGTILITKPSIEITFKYLKTEIILDKWVKSYKSKKYKKESQIFIKSTENPDIKFYEVL
ncbi:hypothetical protein HZU73_04737 [Apis mellifera caucasica]|uniref:Uncharacterized protein LOC726964 isoform X1 n=2 Tax=Apis mellifera TaxID=7460 RepID=A0A7M7MQN0_APIME|nr:uncharacterized protein LOC726964 isoform X1 [Apis mellifera]KAG6799929.1 hypothetical protein HZU73_04737 [Apis mellifera caucasica]KAG9435850.1 hypothetical protein HZU67_02273 [Apis mellifera carnica]|eukprot:XP_026299458.1 uncharacterized protein LOC726964 isoform X1 [Apis mellifera]